MQTTQIKNPILKESLQPFFQTEDNRKKVLISGGLGFSGTHLVNTLKDQYEITVVDNLSNASIQTAAEFEKQGIKILIEDVRRRKKADDTFSIVFHLAAQTSVTNSVSDPMSDASNNILGTIATIKNYPTKKFIYFSTGAIYGNSFSSSEEDEPDALSAYAMSKLVGEAYIRMYCKDYLILRMANIYGNGSENKSEGAVIDKFKTMNPLVIYGDGNQTRDFLHVDDLIKIICHLTKSKKYGTFNVGTGVSTKIIDLANKMSNGREIIFKSERKGELQNNIMDNSKLRNILPADFKFKTIEQQKNV